MVNATRKNGHMINLEEYSCDGRLTIPSDGKIFDYRKMLDVVKELGRPLTEEEAEQYRMK